jgi:hypothetical protein
MVRVEPPEPPEMLELLIDVRGPDGETEELSLTVPANPLLGVIAILAVPELPASTLMKLELAEISKSGVPTRVTSTTTVIVCESDLLIPVIKTV